MAEIREDINKNERIEAEGGGKDMMESEKQRE